MKFILSEMRNMADYVLPRYIIILDFEATCMKEGVPKPQEIIEFPSIIIDSETNTAISRFQEYVKPVRHPNLTDFCINLTGITQNMVDNGNPIGETIKEYRRWLVDHGLYGDNCIIVTCGNWDLESMYPRQCKTSGLKVSSPFKKWINIKDVFSRFYDVRRPGGLVKMLENLGLEFEGRQHSGIDDCYNTGRVWMRMCYDGMRIEETDVHYL